MLKNVPLYKKFIMAKYKVIALSIGTKHGVKDAGQTVSDTDFPNGHAEKLVESDHLELIKDKKKEDPKKETKKK